MLSVHRVCQEDQGKEELQRQVDLRSGLRANEHVLDHAQNDQHTHAMSLLKKQCTESSGLGPSSYAPIAREFYTLSEDKRDTLKVKFDLAYFVATEKIPYTKYCAIEAYHELHVGISYRNETAGKEFIHYLAKARRNDLL